MFLLNNMGKTVFFGGTFNPPHKAHRMMLAATAGLADVERVLVVPANIPPHKIIHGFCASGADRLNMCRLLCDGVDKSEVSDIELSRGGKSYSYDTLTLLKEKYNELFVLIGGDMMTSFDKWYKYDEILKIAGIIAVRRPGINDEMFDRCAENLRRLGGTVKVIETEMPDISSTEVRQYLESGESGALSDLLPDNILRYIEDRGLYR